jgi:hypothetical protein
MPEPMWQAIGNLGASAPRVCQAFEHATRVRTAHASALLLPRLPQERRLPLHGRVLEREAEEQFLERGMHRRHEGLATLPHRADRVTRKPV